MIGVIYKQIFSRSCFKKVFFCRRFKKYCCCICFQNISLAVGCEFTERPDEAKYFRIYLLVRENSQKRISEKGKHKSSSKNILIKMTSTLQTSILRDFIKCDLKYIPRLSPPLANCPAMSFVFVC